MTRIPTTGNRNTKQNKDQASVAKYTVSLEGIKSVTINFEELRIQDRQAINRIILRAHEAKKGDEKKKNKPKTTDEITEGYDWKDHRGRNIQIGDRVKIFTDGKFGKAGDIAEVYKLSNQGIVCFTLKDKTTGFRKSYNLLLLDF